MLRMCFILIDNLGGVPYRHRFHEVCALRALMHAARAVRENGDDIFTAPKFWILFL